MDIDGIVIPMGISPVIAEDFITHFALPDLRFSAVVPLGGASCVAALQAAAAALAAGICRHVLIPDRPHRFLRRADRHPAPPDATVPDGWRVRGCPKRAIAPATLTRRWRDDTWRFTAQRSKQFGEIAVTMRQHAMLERPMRQCALQSRWTTTRHPA